MDSSLKQQIQSFTNVFSEGILNDNSLPIKTGGRVAQVVSENNRTNIGNNIGNTKAVFSKAIKLSLCSHVEFFYYNKLYMSSCVKELQNLHQLIDTPTVASSVNSHNQSQPSHWNSWTGHLLAGGLAGAVSRTTTAPLDRLKVFLMVYSCKANKLKMSVACRDMLKEGGAKSLWRGNGINVAKVMPEMALKFMVYEEIKSQIKAVLNKKELGLVERFIAGSLAGVVSQTAIYPLEVIKTRLVIRKTNEFRGICDCAKSIFRNNGLRGFYRGYIPNVVGIVPYAGIDLAIYETLKRSFISRSSTNEQPGMEVLVFCGVVSSTCGQLVSYPLALVRTRLQAHAVAVEGSVTSIIKTIVTTDGAAGLYRGLVANLLKVAPAVSIGYIVYEKSRLWLGVEMS